jgi:hypothetical protein
LDYVARFEAKLSLTKSSLTFAENGPKIVFPKNAFPVPFYKTAPLTYFPNQTNYVAHFEAKLSQTKTSLAFA